MIIFTLLYNDVLMIFMALDLFLDQFLMLSQETNTLEQLVLVWWSEVTLKLSIFHEQQVLKCFIPLTPKYFANYLHFFWTKNVTFFVSSSFSSDILLSKWMRNPKSWRRWHKHDATVRYPSSANWTDKQAKVPLHRFLFMDALSQWCFCQPKWILVVIENDILKLDSLSIS